jgi:MFS family permease
VAFAILAQTPGDYHSVFIVSFGAAVVGLAILLLIVPDIRPRRRARAASPTAAVGEAPENAVTAVQPAAPRPSLKMLASRNFALLAAATGLLGVLTIGDGFLYLALQRRDDLAIKYFPLLYVGTNIAYMLLAIPFGRLADRIGRVKVFIGGHLGLLLAYLCAGGPFSGTALTLACLALLGVYYAATDGVLAAIASRISPVGAKASGIATVQTVQASARFFASLGFGLVWSLFGQRTALLSVSMVFVVAVPIAWTMLRTTERQFGQPGALAHG